MSCLLGSLKEPAHNRYDSCACSLLHDKTPVSFLQGEPLIN